MRAQARKDVAQIFNILLRRQIGTRWPTVEYLSTKDEVVFAALKGCVRTVCDHCALAEGRAAMRTRTLPSIPA
jgi:hypothetical protein